MKLFRLQFNQPFKEKEKVTFKSLLEQGKSNELSFLGKTLWIHKMGHTVKQENENLI